MSTRPTFAVHGLRQQKSAGFTLFESIVVIVLLGIMAIYAIPKFEFSTITLDSQVRTVVSNIQRAQNLAISTGNRTHFCVLTSTTYRIQIDGSDCNTPTGTSTYPVSVALEKGIMFSSTVPSYVSFDSLGQPAAGSSSSFTLGSRSIGITPVTGFLTY